MQFNRLGGENLLPYNGPFIVDAIIDGQTPGAGHLHLGGRCARAPASVPPTSASRRTSPRPAAFNTATTQVRYIPADNRTGYVQSWHFTVQRELAKNLLLDVGYVGNHAVGSDDPGRLQSGRAERC